MVPLLSFFALIAVIAYQIRLNQSPALIILTALGGTFLLWAMNSRPNDYIADGLQIAGLLCAAIILWRRLGIRRMPIIIAGCFTYVLATTSYEALLRVLIRLYAEQSIHYIRAAQLSDLLYVAIDAGIVLMGIGLIILLSRRERSFRFL